MVLLDFDFKLLMAGFAILLTAPFLNRVITDLVSGVRYRLNPPDAVRIKIHRDGGDTETREVPLTGDGKELIDALLEAADSN